MTTKQMEFRIVFKPPDGHPTHFKDIRHDTNPETGEDVPVEIEREYRMDMTLRASSKEAAKLQAERHIFNVAVQEAGTEDPDEVLKRQWKIESIKEVKD
jgi:hypothetical protein